MVQYTDTKRVIGDGNSGCAWLHFDARVVSNMFLYLRCAAPTVKTHFIIWQMRPEGKWEFSFNHTWSFFIIHVGLPRISLMKNILTLPGSILFSGSTLATTQTSNKLIRRNNLLRTINHSSQSNFRIVLHSYYFLLLWQGFVSPHTTCDKNKELM